MNKNSNRKFWLHTKINFRKEFRVRKGTSHAIPIKYNKNKMLENGKISKNFGIYLINTIEGI